MSFGYQLETRRDSDRRRRASWFADAPRRAAKNVPSQRNRLGAIDPPQPPLSFAEQFQVLLMVPVDGAAMGDAEEDGVGVIRGVPGFRS